MKSSWFGSLVVLSFGVAFLAVLGSFWGRFGIVLGCSGGRFGAFSAFQLCDSTHQPINSSIQPINSSTHRFNSSTHQLIDSTHQPINSIPKVDDVSSCLWLRCVRCCFTLVFVVSCSLTHLLIYSSTHGPSRFNPSTHQLIDSTHQPINSSIQPINPSTHRCNPSTHRI